MIGRALALALAALCIAGTAGADSITIDGLHYEDVLVYKSSSTYYVKIPQEGRVISAPIDSVNDESVTINKDPYYRDNLKQQYEQAKADLEAGKTLEPAGQEINAAFNVPESDGSDGGIDTSALLGGPGKPLGISQQQVVNQLQGQGITFNGQIGKSADGVLTVQLQGPADNLTGITATAKGQMAQLMPAMQKVGAFVGQVAPWSGQWLQQNRPKLLQGQPIEASREGVHIKIAGSQPGPDGNITVTFTMQGA